VPVAEPLQINPGLMRRSGLMAVANPRSVKRVLWLNGALGFWALIGAVSSLAVRQWTIAAMSLAAAALSGFMWWVLRRSMRRIPQSRQGLEALSTS
jgi:hypothetical protein